MAMIAVGISAVVVIYSVLFLNTNERPSERYFAIMLMTTAGVVGAVFAGDFSHSSSSGKQQRGFSFLMLYRKNATSLNATLKYIVMIVIASAFIVFGFPSFMVSLEP